MSQYRGGTRETYHNIDEDEIAKQHSLVADGRSYSFEGVQNLVLLKQVLTSMLKVEVFLKLFEEADKRQEQKEANQWEKYLPNHKHNANGSALGGGALALPLPTVQVGKMTKDPKALTVDCNQKQVQEKET